MKIGSKDVLLTVGPTTKMPGAPPLAFDPIAAALQQIHDKVADEPIPDDFMALLDQFEVEDKIQ